MRPRAILARANRIAEESSAPGAPLLAPDSPRTTVCAWLQWCDPNGSHTDAVARANGHEPYTLDEAWDALAEMVTRD